MITRNNILNYVFQLLRFPVFFSSIYLCFVGSYFCILKNNQLIEVCTVNNYLTQDINLIILYINYSCQVILNIVPCLSLGAFGLYNCTHIGIKIKKKYKTNCTLCGKRIIPCDIIANWIYYLVPLIMLCIECFWQFGEKENNWILTSLIFVEIITTTWFAMTIFTTNLRNVTDLTFNNDEDLNNSTLFDKSGITQNELNDITNDNVPKKLTKSVSYFCCFQTNTRWRFVWAPNYLINAFFYNICWFIYDFFRISIKMNDTGPYSRFRIIMAGILIAYRLLYASATFNKFLNNNTNYLLFSGKVIDDNSQNGDDDDDDNERARNNYNSILNNDDDDDRDDNINSIINDSEYSRDK